MKKVENIELTPFVKEDLTPFHIGNPVVKTGKFESQLGVLTGYDKYGIYVYFAGYHTTPIMLKDRDVYFIKVF